MVSAPFATSGRTYCSTSARVAGESRSPRSTCSASPGHACISVPPGAGYCPTSRSSFELESVTLVAMTPTTPVRVAATAGFTAGSMATMAIGRVAGIADVQDALVRQLAPDLAQDGETSDTGVEDADRMAGQGAHAG